MNKVLAFVKSRWFITFIGVLALMLLVWFVGPLIAIAEYKPLAVDWVRMLVIVLMILAWVGSNLYREHKARNAANHLADGISKDAGESENYDVSAVKSQVTQAVEILKKSSKGKKRNSQVLYELPWYLLIGPPGSGKTTALVNSGLHFPLEDKFGKNSVKGVGGTRHCDWWFTNEAVLIDTAGRYTTQDSHAQADRAEWKSFIDLLKKHRKRRPINGVMVAVSILDIIQKTDSERDQQVKAIRARLQEIVDDLGVHVPIYLMFTKCDLVDGFLDSFESMSKEQRAQVWGMTLPEDQIEDGSYQQWFDHEFELLVQQLQYQQTNKFYFERDIGRRSHILNFPHRLRGLQESLSEFVGGAFSDSRFHDQFMLRGIYFTSGTQESGALSRAISSMANPLGIQAKNISNHLDKGRSYFIRNLLHEVIFKEAELVGLNRKHENLSKWIRSATAIVCLASLVGAGFGLSSTVASNQISLNEIESYIDKYNVAAEFPDSIKPLKVLPLFSLHQQMFNVFSDDRVWFEGMGLDQGQKVNSAVEKSITDLNQGIFLTSLKNELEGALRESQSNPQSLRHALKAYLMLADQDHHDAEYLQDWFDHFWNNKYFDLPNEKQQLSNRLTSLLENFPYLDINHELVANARSIIRSVPLHEQVFFSIKSEADFKLKSQYRFSQVLGSDFHRVFKQTESSIPRFFTYQGYSEYFKPGLESAIDELSNDNWVVGRSEGDQQLDLTEMDLAAVHAKVEKRYYDEYIAHWERHLYSVSLKKPQTLDEMANFIDSLRSGRSALRGILDEVNLNTQLTVSLVSEEEIKQNMQDAQAVARTIDPRATKLARITRLASRNRFANMPETPTSMVDKRFADVNRFVEPNGSRASEIDLLMEELAELQIYIEGMINGGSLSETAYENALQRFTSGKQNIISSLKLKARHYPEPVRQWVTKLANNVWGEVVGQAHSYIAKKYEYNLWPVYRATLENRYPFSKRSAQEATLSDFASFFKKDGDLDIFFKDYVEPFVDKSAKPWRLKSIDGFTIGISRHHLKQFETAEKIRKSFFGRESDPNITFSIRPIYLDANVSKLELNMMGERQVYRHGPPQLQDIEWPPQSLESTIAYQFEDYYRATDGDSVDGAWSLFRFFDKYPLSRGSHGNRFELALESNGKKAVYELIAAKNQSPLGKNHLSQFKLPTRL